MHVNRRIHRIWDNPSKSSVAKCEGAQEAVENIQQQFEKKKSEVVTKENIDVCAKNWLLINIREMEVV
jgi:hypothetical protein